MQLYHNYKNKFSIIPELPLRSCQSMLITKCTIVLYKFFSIPVGVSEMYHGHISTVFLIFSIVKHLLAPPFLNTYLLITELGEPCKNRRRRCQTPIATVTSVVMETSTGPTPEVLNEHSVDYNEDYLIK